MSPARQIQKLCVTIYDLMPFAFKYPRTSHIGHHVSHAKNRTRRRFRYNLHTVTVIMDGVKKRLRVPTKVLRSLRQQGVTTHWKKPELA